MFTLILISVNLIHLFLVAHSSSMHIMIAFLKQLYFKDYILDSYSLKKKIKPKFIICQHIFHICIKSHKYANWLGNKYESICSSQNPNSINKYEIYLSKKGLSRCQSSTNDMNT